ncbi:cerebellin-3-like [Mercenaria mercenaria]|uniref:cerebellin-3-like n=1 Tax=Mercenaria mercenaria TaxID=6596 RepID=UPI00234F2408|nr:cerebellin-3-like [Mercenaria mercenaria]
MLQVEAKMEQWDKELKQFEETILSVLEYRGQEMRKSINKQNKKLEIFTEEYNTVQAALENLTAEVTPIIAFNAYLNTSGSYPVGQIVVFPHVILNEGDGYNSTTGYFTAPVAGLYHFTAHVCNLHDQYMVFSIVKGNTTIALSAVYENSSVTCGSVSAPTPMEVGEKVCVQSPYADSSLFTNLYRWPSFMGVLVKRSRRNE